LVALLLAAMDIRHCYLPSGRQFNPQWNPLAAGELLA
jgi:hypothetical protein